jgi:hypothetical protein
VRVRLQKRALPSGRAAATYLHFVARLHIDNQVAEGHIATSLLRHSSLITTYVLAGRTPRAWRCTTRACQLHPTLPPAPVSSMARTPLSGLLHALYT